MKDDPLGRRFVRFTPSSTASDLATVGTVVIIRSTVGGTGVPLEFEFRK